jgi:hypothetical protein
MEPMSNAHESQPALCNGDVTGLQGTIDTLMAMIAAADELLVPMGEPHEFVDNPQLSLSGVNYCASETDEECGRYEDDPIHSLAARKYHELRQPPDETATGA